MNDGGCLWITGLSAAGKTTTSLLVHDELKKSHSNVVLLDGDQLRAIFNRSSGSYDRNARVETGLIYSRLIKELVEQRLFVVIAVIGLYDEVNTWNRENIPNFYDVFLDVPVDELEARDPKGMYKKFRSGLISDVAGLDLKVDYPSSPWMHLKWTKDMTPNMISALILHNLRESYSNRLFQN